MIIEEIRKSLFLNKDNKYKDFQSKLIPTVNAEYFIGVRTPDLKQFAKSLRQREDIALFLDNLPHKYFDENQLHAFIVSEITDFKKCMEEVIRFLPFIDNWATCDQLSPKVLKKHPQELLDQIKVWIYSEKTYTVRFGIEMLMRHFLDENFDLAYPEMIAEIRSDEYYVNMMIAWYFATALAKHYDLILPFIKEQRLDIWTHNKAIQKSLESYRISQEKKNYLKSMKRTLIRR